MVDNRLRSSDRGSVILNIISFLFPIIGFFLWLANKSSKPERASQIGLAAIIGFLFNFIGFWYI